MTGTYTQTSKGAYTVDLSHGSIGVESELLTLLAGYGVTATVAKQSFTGKVTSATMATGSFSGCRQRQRPHCRTSVHFRRIDRKESDNGISGSPLRSPQRRNPLQTPFLKEFFSLFLDFPPSN